MPLPKDKENSLRRVKARLIRCGKSYALLSCMLLLLLIAACTFPPAQFYALQKDAKTATYTTPFYGIYTQSADLPVPVLLVKGRALSFDKGRYGVEELLSFFHASTVGKETLQGVTLYHAYAPGLGECERLPCGRVNLQIAVGETYLAVATPVFYGSF